MANNYTLGRGEIYFGRFLTGTQTPEGERYLGNTPEFSMTLEPEMLDHFSSDRGIREKDDSVTLQINRTGAMTCDNIDPENLAILLMGEKSVQAQAATPVVGEAVTAAGKAGMWYQLGTSPTNPSGVRDVASVAIKAGATTLVLNTDYVLDAPLGRFQVVEGGDGDGVALTADYTPAAKSRIRVLSKGDTIEGSLRFIAKNPKGAQFDYFFPWVKLTPNGDFQVKAEEWQTIPFNLEILKPADAEAIYVDGRPYTP